MHMQNMEPMQEDLLRLTLHYMDVATCMCLLHCDTELGKSLVQRLLAMGIDSISGVFSDCTCMVV